MTNGTRSGWGISVTPRPLFTPGKDPVPIAQEAGCAPGPVWTGVENLAAPGFDPRTVQSVASRYIDWATRPNLYSYIEFYFIAFCFLSFSLYLSTYCCNNHCSLWSTIDITSNTRLCVTSQTAVISSTILMSRYYLEVMWSVVMWGELTWFMWSNFIIKWSEVIYGEVLVDRGAMYIRMTLYCGHLIILWLFHLGISCTAFVLICTVVGLYCIVMCVCVCVGFVMCVCVCVCVGFVMCVFVWVFW